MIAAMILYSLVVGAVLAGGALLIDWGARRAALPRRWGWLGALAMLLALTVVAPWRAGSTPSTTALPTLPAGMEVNTDAALAAPAGLWERTLSGLASVLTIPTEQLLSSVAEGVPASLDVALGWAWGVAALVCLIVTGWALNRLDRQRRVWPRATVLGLPVRVAANHGPAVYGVFEPDIVLPTALLSRSGREQELVLAHEDEHRRAYDPLLLAVSALGVSLMPWNPFAWYCASRLRLAVELDCDTRVLARGAAPRQYGEMLLTIASALSTRRGLVPALSLLDSRRHLERRLLAMTARPARRTPFHVATVLVLGSVVIAAACNTDLPTAAQIEEADVATVTEQLGVVAGVRVVYFVDGEEVSADKAQALAGDAIASIEVVKGRNANSGDGQIRIMRKANYVAATQDMSAGEKTELETIFEERLKDDVIVVDRKGKGDGSTETTFVVRTTDANGSIRLRGDSVSVGSVTSQAVQPLMIIDGVIITGGKGELGELGITPDKIARIEVVKGEAAMREFGDRGKAGVIKITTKERR